MIPIPSGVRVWIATGHTDMRRGMQGLALTVQESLKRDPHAGDLYIFRGRRGDLAKILWHDGLGLSLYAKRLDRGKFIWPGFGENLRVVKWIFERCDGIGTGKETPIGIVPTPDAIDQTVNPPDHH